LTFKHILNEKTGAVKFFFEALLITEVCMTIKQQKKRILIDLFVS